MNEAFQKDTLPEDEYVTQDDLNKALGFDLTKDMLKPYEHERLATFLKTTDKNQLHLIERLRISDKLGALRFLLFFTPDSIKDAWTFLVMIDITLEDYEKAVYNMCSFDDPIQDGLTVAQTSIEIFRKTREINIELHTFIQEHSITLTTAESILKNTESKLLSAIFKALTNKNGETHYLLNKEIIENFWNNIQRISTDTLLFTSICKTLSKQGDLDFNEMHDVTLSSQQGSELSKEQRTDIFNMVVKGYEQYPERYDDDFILKIKTMLPGKLKSPNTKFYMLTKGGKLISTLRFDSIYDSQGALTSKYLGSFSLDTAYHNGAIGQALFAEALKTEEEAGIPIQLHCDARPENKPVQDLYTSHGFTIIETNTTYTPSVPLLFMEKA